MSNIKKSYRRVASSQVLLPPADTNVSLSDLFRTQNADGKNYILVEESRLSELTKLENILRTEKAMLGEQCVMVLSEVNVTARIPMPAIRLAMHSLCDAEMKKYSKLIASLHEEWRVFARKNNYHKSFLASNASYVNSAPEAQKMSKIKYAYEANQKYLLRKARDTMVFEDNFSRYADKFIDAELRRQDYERYYVLATKYGVFDEKEFARDAWPGTRYYKMATRAAQMLQKRWAVYWPIKKMRMHRAARMFQALWRGHAAYRVWHPIIMLSLHVGKRSYFRHSWGRWLEYNKLCRQIKASLRFFMDTYTRRCFVAWRKYSVDQKLHKQDLLNRFARRIKNSSLHMVYSRWAAFAKRSAYVKLFARRLFQNPHFHVWVQYTKKSKYIKRLGRFATRIQACGRGYNMRRRYKQKKRAAAILRSFYQIMLAKRRARQIRDDVITSEYAKWRPEEMESRHQRAVEKERRRLVWQHQVTQEKESAMKLDLKRHLRTRSGRIQINEVAKVMMSTRDVDWRRAVALAKEELIAECGCFARKIGKHDFNAKSPPFIVCADNACRVICVSEEQYVSHVQNTDHHKDKDCSFLRLHLSLKDSKAQEAWRQFLIRTEGFGERVNILDLWSSIQEWRKVHVSSESYTSRAVFIYETFLQEQCIRQVGIAPPNFADIVKKLEHVKNREFEGLYSLKTRQKGFLRRLFRLSGVKYEAWTAENIVSPDMYDEVEWWCMLQMSANFPINEFEASPEGLQLRAQNEASIAANEKALFDLYVEFRQRNFMFWTLEFVRQEKQLDAQAETLVNLCVASICDSVSYDTCNAATLEKVFVVGHDEQNSHEFTNLLVDDVVYWTTENIVEGVYAHFVKATVDTMWDIPDCRKQLLEFAGYLRKTAKARLLIDMKKKGMSYDWFEEFLTECLAEEKKSLPLNPDSAALAIQRRLRGNWGRSKARKVFVQTYMKRFDQSSGLHYYINISSGTSSWQRPLITRYIFPNSVW